MLYTVTIYSSFLLLQGRVCPNDTSKTVLYFPTRIIITVPFPQTIFVYTGTLYLHTNNKSLLDLDVTKLSPKRKESSPYFSNEENEA